MKKTSVFIALKTQMVVDTAKYLSSKKLGPIIIIMLLLGTLIVLAEGSAVAPFIYTLF